MSYLVLARKYRPQTFTEVVGQEHVTRTLANAFEQDRVHHAFLFCGPRGVGKTTLARILGKALNCEAGPSAEPCGRCSPCTTITNGSAVDYYEMDGASNRGIDAIRELTDAVRYQPAALRKKVYVIDEVHMLTTEAFNALLKTLEEPPPHVTFVLATTEPHKVPNTILSRCQRYDFKLVPMPRLVAHLSEIFTKEELTVEPGAVALLARESGGSVRDALSLSDQIISYAGHDAISERRVAEVLGVADRSVTRTLVMSLAEGDAATALEAVEAAVARGVDEVQLARAIVSHLRDLAVVQVAPDRRGLVDGSDEDLAELRRQAEGIERSRLHQMFDRMLRACQDLGQSQQPRLVLDLALIDVAALQPVLPLGDLLERLAELEGRLGGGGGGSRGGAAPPGSRRSSPPPAARGPARRAEPPRQEAAARPEAASGGDEGGRPATPTMPPSEGMTGVTAGGGDGIGPPTPTLPPSGGRRDVTAGNGAAEVQRADARGSGAGAHRGDARGSNGVNGSAAGAGTMAAAGAATAVVVPGTPEEMLREWERVIAALEQARRLPLVGLYEHARIISWHADRIEVGFTTDDLLAERATEREQVEAMRAFLQEHYGRPLGFTVRTLREGEAVATDNARSLIEVEKQRTEALRGQREAEAREHPATRMVLETFGAQIKEIKTDV